MYQCNSGKHAWTNPADAGCCCNPKYSRVLAFSQEVKDKSIGQPNLSSIGVPYVWMENAPAREEAEDDYDEEQLEPGNCEQCHEMLARIDEQRGHSLCSDCRWQKAIEEA